ncbi:MAG TPA: flagellin [Phenylobacterium sp.]|uniref:flagellin N-terminal helical domain-containing protein n=1 Tax=Phenylobacterium sp. TaxID=1871053 RepID=UPI002CD842AC|nr:flagellin [Phenylobacterium sp.]HSV03913.1 flagellin [Phenylobacterium sp.]
MVTRVSTVGNYSAILANLMAAQQAQLQAGVRVSTQKNGSDLKDYAKNDELLTAMRSVQTRLTGFQDQNSLIADKLTTQDTALNQVADAAQAIREAIADALASGNATTLMAEVQGEMNQAVGAMNTKYNGNYLFAGGQINTQPVTAQQLSDLTAGPPIGSFFQNDQFKAQANIDDSTAVTTGILASDIGTPLLNALQTLKAFDQGGSGPLGANLTPAQRTFLVNQLSTWDSVHQGITTITAGNGMVQKRVDDIKTDLSSRQTTLAGMVSNITDADMAKAAADLQLAQTSFAAAAQVFQTLKDSSLINLLAIQ